MFQKKLNILRNIFGYNYSTGGELLFKCPRCNHHKNKLSINIEKNAYKCWVCEYSGNSIFSLVKRYGSYSQKKEWEAYEDKIEILDFDRIFFQTEEEEEVEILSLPKDFKTLTGKDKTSSSIKYINYLKSRNILEKDILKWKIGYSSEGEYANRVIIPSFDTLGNLNYFIARDVGDDWLKYKNPPISKDVIFNDLFVDWNSDVVLVEGVFDAINAENSVPILGSTLSEKSKLFQKIVKKSPNIYIALDSDAEKKSINIIKNLLQYGIRVYKVDISPYPDVSEMPKEVFEERREKATFVDSGDYLLYRTLNM